MDFLIFRIREPATMARLKLLPAKGTAVAVRRNHADGATGIDAGPNRGGLNDFISDEWAIGQGHGKPAPERRVIEAVNRRHRHFHRERPSFLELRPPPRRTARRKRLTQAGRNQQAAVLPGSLADWESRAPAFETRGVGPDTRPGRPRLRSTRRLESSANAVAKFRRSHRLLLLLAAIVLPPSPADWRPLVFAHIQTIHLYLLPSPYLVITAAGFLHASGAQAQANFWRRQSLKRPRPVPLLSELRCAARRRECGKHIKSPRHGRPP